MTKLLDDAWEAGFVVMDDEIYLHAGRNSCAITSQLIKFAELQIPDGYKLVPIEPTVDMIESTLHIFDLERHSRQLKLGIDTYKAMLAASPPTDKDIK